MAGLFSFRAYSIDVTGLRLTQLTEGAFLPVLRCFPAVLLERQS